MGGKSDYFSVVRLFQSLLPSLSRDVAHTESEGTQTPKISSCFSKLLIMFFQRRNFFSPRLCVCDDSEVFPPPQTLHELPLFLQKLLGVESKGEIFLFFFFSDFSYENLRRLTFEAVASCIFGEKLFEACRKL